MPLIDYVVSRDKFKEEPLNGLDFPCCACAHRHVTDMDEPCRHCDHNMNSVPDEVPPTIQLRGAIDNQGKGAAACGASRLERFVRHWITGELNESSNRTDWFFYSGSDLVLATVPNIGARKRI